MLSLADFRSLCPDRIQEIYTLYLSSNPSAKLNTALNYSLFNEGKYLRPLLVYTTGNIFKTALEELDAAAAAVEIIHTYSLIHDDLPCMDNADLRRGQPSCHKKFNEGLAVLVGDGLQTLAFEILATHPSRLTSEQRLKMITSLAQAAGINGMVAGQALDITEMHEAMSMQQLTNIYTYKTGALLKTSIHLGFIASSNKTCSEYNALMEFADCMGLAFQIQDDILDINSHTSGKTQGNDAKNNKITVPRLEGIQVAQEKVTQLYKDAFKHLDIFGDRAHALRELTSWLMQRIN